MTNELMSWEDDGGRTARDEIAEVRDRLIDVLAGLCPALLHDEVLLDSLLRVVNYEVRRVLAERRREERAITPSRGQRP